MNISNFESSTQLNPVESFITYVSSEYSKEQYFMNELTGLSWGLDSMSLKCSYEFRMMNLSSERWREHQKLFYKKCQENDV